MKFLAIIPIVAIVLFLAYLAIPDEILANIGIVTGMSILAVLIGLAIGAISFLVIAGILWLICWAFSLTFSWKIAFGIWLILLILRWVFSRRK